MTVVSSSNTITFAGDGVQTLFDFNFKIFKEEDLAAVVRDSCGIERELVAGSDFKLVSETGNDSGGRAMYPVSGSPLQPGDSITFYREIAYSQELELVDNDPFSAGLLNEAFDRGVMRDQQLQEQVARALKYDISTPAEDQLMPQEFMRNIIEARDDSATARAGAESALSKSEAAQLAAEYAKLGAETAQAAAEYAKSEAEAIAWDGIEHLRSSTPVLSGPESANEGTTVEVSIVDYVEDSLANYEINVSGFGYAKLVGSVIKWTLGSVDVDTVYSMKVVKRRCGEIYSETVDYRLLVKNVLISDGPTMAFANDYKGWPSAAIDAEVIQPPAFSVGAVNEKQIVSGKMEVDVTSGQKTVLDGTTATFLKVLEEIYAGMVLVTDKGPTLVTNVTMIGEIPDSSYWSTGSNCVINTGSLTGLKNPGGAVKSLTATLNPKITFNAYRNTNRGLNVSICPISEIGSFYATGYIGGVNNMPNSYTLGFNSNNTAVLLKGWSTIVGSAVTTERGDKFSVEKKGTVINVYRNGDLLWTVETFNSEAQHIVCGLYDSNDKMENILIGDIGYTGNIDLPEAPTKVFKHPLQGEALTVGAMSSSTSLDTTEIVTAGESLFINGVSGVAGSVTFANDIYITDITSFGLTTPPQYASRKKENILALGAGGIGEYIGPEIVVEQGEGSTASKLVLISAGSIAAKLFVEGGFHNDILCDNSIKAKVASVSEEIVTVVSPVKQLIPDMTGETTDGCTITASRSDYSPAYACWKVGKADQPALTNYWQANGYPTDLVIAFDSPKTISKYSLISALSYVQNSQTWALYKGASLTGPWTLLHRQAAVFTWSSTGGGTQTLNFDLGASHTANYFKLNCGNTAQHGYSGFGRVRLFGTESKKATKTTVNLTTPLAKVPTKVAIPDRYNLTPAGYASELSDGKLKITADKIELPNNVNIKQLAMAVRSPEDMRFTDGKIYIQEKP